MKHKYVISVDNSTCPPMVRIEDTFAECTLAVMSANHPMIEHFWNLAAIAEIGWESISRGIKAPHDISFN